MGSSLVVGYAEHINHTTRELFCKAGSPNCNARSAEEKPCLTLEPHVAELPAVLAALAGHPVLWLVLGRAGVDRPGSLGAVVGQQVVTVTRVNRRALLVVAALMLLAGLAVGLVIGLWLHGGI